jgi:hypothetical protein
LTYFSIPCGSQMIYLTYFSIPRCSQMIYLTYFGIPRGSQMIYLTYFSIPRGSQMIHLTYFSIPRCSQMIIWLISVFHAVVRRYIWHISVFHVVVRLYIWHISVCHAVVILGSKDIRTFYWLTMWFPMGRLKCEANLPTDRRTDGRLTMDAMQCQNLITWVQMWFCDDMIQTYAWQSKLPIYSIFVIALSIFT